MRAIFLVVCAVALGGCKSLRDEFSGRSTSMSGAGVILGTSLTPYGANQLTALIRQATPVPTPPDRKDESPPGLSDDAERADWELDRAIGGFSSALYTGGGWMELRQNQMRYARNQVQGMLMTRSANLCTAYKLALRERSTNVSFWLGTAGTLLGTAGALVTGSAAQVLSAAAGAASGTKAEYERDILSSVTTTVIVPGIDKQRTALQQEIASRRCLGVASYTLSEALLDALRYHSACSTDTGIAAAGSAISQSRVTSLADAKDAVDAVNALHASLRGGGATQATTVDTQTKLPLLGDPVNMGQCPNLDAKGLMAERPGVQASKVVNASPSAGSGGVQSHETTPPRVFNGQVHFDLF